MSKLFIQDSFEGMPRPKANVRPEDGSLLDYTEVYTNFKVGNVYYRINGDKLQAFKVLGYFVRGHKDMLLRTLHPDGSIWYYTVDQYTHNVIFHTVDDYYKFIEGDETAKISLSSRKLSEIMPTHSLPKRTYYSGGVPRLRSRRYYIFDRDRHTAQEHLGYISALFFDGKDWYMQSSPFDKMDLSDYKGDIKFYASKAECVKDNIIGTVVDFDDETPPKVDVKVEIKVTPPAPKVRKITIIEE